ncbi:transposase, partial [Vibrio ostreicida]|uniref:transposase n=1 Tax=Vibrio ostreicida TaxID=526588 RepID=UPI003B5A11B4
KRNRYSRDILIPSLGTIMTRARNQQICLAATPYYHCVSRCVRRTFLCGYDAHTQKSYEHRREWIASRIQTLSQIFCIDICAYAVMSNHYHLVVHINQARAQAMSDQQIIERWSQLHTQPVLIQRFLSHSLGSDAEHQAALTLIAQWRERLFSLSWFMRELNFEIALKANKEDRCTGHFWESRYKSQALLDEKALLAAMAYTDLNPIRAGLSDTLQACDYTSIKVRLETLSQPQPSAPCLHPFIGHADQTNLDGLPFRLVDYLELVDSGPEDR